MAMHAEEEEEESAASTGFLRRTIAACRPSAWWPAPFQSTSSSSSSVLAAEAGGGAGQMEMAMLPGYQRLSSTCETTLPDNGGGDYRPWWSACLPQAARMLWGILTRLVLWWRGEDEHLATAPAPATGNGRRRSSWRPDPNERWPVQGWC